MTAVSTSPRAIVVEGAPLLDLTRPNALVLQIGVVPGQASAIARSDKADITPVGASRSYTGRVVFRGSVVDTSNGLVPMQSR